MEVKITGVIKLYGDKFANYGTEQEPVVKFKDVMEWLFPNCDFRSRQNTLIKKVNEANKFKAMCAGITNPAWFITGVGLAELIVNYNSPVVKDYAEEAKDYLRKAGLDVKGSHKTIAQLNEEIEYKNRLISSLIKQLEDNDITPLIAIRGGY